MAILVTFPKPSITFLRNFINIQQNNFIKRVIKLHWDVNEVD